MCTNVARHCVTTQLTSTQSAAGMGSGAGIGECPVLALPGSNLRQRDEPDLAIGVMVLLPSLCCMFLSKQALVDVMTLCVQRLSATQAEQQSSVL
jgi:hypothetical protein